MVKKKSITNGVEIIHRRYFEGKPEMLAALEDERANAEIAQIIYDLREDAHLTQIIYDLREDAHLTQIVYDRD